MPEGTPYDPSWLARFKSKPAVLSAVAIAGMLGAVLAFSEDVAEAVKALAHTSEEVARRGHMRLAYELGEHVGILEAYARFKAAHIGDGVDPDEFERHVHSAVSLMQQLDLPLDAEVVRKGEAGTGDKLARFLAHSSPDGRRAAAAFEVGRYLTSARVLAQAAVNAEEREKEEVEGTLYTNLVYSDRIPVYFQRDIYGDVIYWCYDVEVGSQRIENIRFVSVVSSHDRATEYIDGFRMMLEGAKSAARESGFPAMKPLEEVRPTLWTDGLCRNSAGDWIASSPLTRLAIDRSPLPDSARERQESHECAGPPPLRCEYPESQRWSGYWARRVAFARDYGKQVSKRLGR